MKVCATTEMPAGRRVADWNELFSTELERAEFRPARPERFEARLAKGDIGSIRVARLSCAEATFERLQTHIAQRGAPTYFAFLQVRGSGELSHFGLSDRIAVGDLVLCDGGAPFNIKFSEAAELLILCIPAALMKEHLPSPECFCGRVLRAGDGLTSVAGGMAENLFERLEAGLALHYQDRVARHLLDMIATAYVVGFDGASSGSSIVSGRRATVKLYIEQNLRNPELTPCLVATRLKLSSRYLRMIFATDNETVSAYILRRRLEECARQIADPSWRGHSMTEIAFRWGFNSAPHFTRSFRDRYDVSPREYRRAKLEQEDSPFRPRVTPAKGEIRTAAAA